MKPLLCILCSLAIFGCNGNENENKTIDSETLRNRNLALAYIDSGMMEEASEKLAVLEASLPGEAFVYANQGLVALRQNKLEEAATLLQKADTLAKNHPGIALLRGEVAMLIGQFEQSTQILEDAIQANPKNIQLRWARNDSKEHLQVIVGALSQNIVARLALIKEQLKDEQFSNARTNLLALREQQVILDEQATGLFKGAMVQLNNKNARAARAQVIGLDNVLKPTRAWQHSLIEVAGPPGTVGHPLREFVNTNVPDSVKPIAKQVSFTKDESSIQPPNKKHLVIVESQEQTNVVQVEDFSALVTTPIDWNNDRKVDVAVGTLDGKVFIEGGKELLTENNSPVFALTPWDADQDGDLDLLVSRETTFLLQNNGDETASVVEIQTPLLILTSIIDIDEDGAVDVVGISEDRKLVLLKNERSGNIHSVLDIMSETFMSDLTVADFNNDGWMDIAYIDKGVAFVAENNHEMDFVPRKIGGFGLNILAADIDNDTKQDIIVGGDNFEIFFANGTTTTVDAVGEAQIIDVDLDGDLDIATSGTEFAIWHQDGTPSENEYQKIILEAILEGGQRNNALAVGGFVEVSAGGNYQKHLITGPLTHIGLGGQPADAIRVVWPNGVPQEVIEPVPNQVFTEVQILKGSCPFLATKNEDGSWEFVTDLLWRSPLGLKINAQTVPPIAATQDWVKVSGDQLRSVNGEYELAVTAQLWETHFIDEIFMIAIDHPIDTEVFVDERFVAPVPPQYQLYAYENLYKPTRATDQDNRDVLNLILERDSNRLGGFAKGPYQGVGEDHFVELEFAGIKPRLGVDVVAQGWIRPTDTSINIASAQNMSAPVPSGIRVDVPDGQDGWKTVISNGGFPAGKLKTVILEIPPDSFVNDDYRIRIATNLEIYWDRIVCATASCTRITTVPIELLSAELGYMGFPYMSRTDDDAPNIPDYNDIRFGNAWRDLEGFYTRYGAVEELLSNVDDRYVIMNAGDAMYVRFDALEPPKVGFTRDYVFFSDGWVKDGDWNTVDSRTVGPLPFHSMSGYPYPEIERPAELLSSHSDWQKFHTRYITPAPFLNTLKK